MAMASTQTLELMLPYGPLGVGITKAIDGRRCVVFSKDKSVESPLLVDDCIVSLNSTKLSSMKGGVREWVKAFQSCSTAEYLPRHVVIERRTMATVEAEGERDESTSSNETTNKSKTMTGQIKTDQAAISKQSAINKQSGTENDKDDAEKSDKGIAKSTTTSNQPSAKSPAPPLDIVAEKDHYRYLFREYKNLSDRHKQVLISANDPVKWPVPDGYCTKILGADFAQTLAPFEDEDNVPFSHDSITNEFAV